MSPRERGESSEIEVITSKDKQLDFFVLHVACKLPVLNQIWSQTFLVDQFHKLTYNVSPFSRYMVDVG